MSGRTIISYFDIDNYRWCSDTGAPILERFYPEFNLYETPVLVVNLLDGDGDAVSIPANSTFDFTVTDLDYAPIAVPCEGGVNNSSDYENVDATDGIFSFRISFATEEAEAVLTNYRRAMTYVNLNIVDPATSHNLNLSAQAFMNKVYKDNATVVPIGSNTQFRINATDGGIDMWDYTAAAWRRPALEDGVLNYYPAP